MGTSDRLLVGIALFLMTALARAQWWGGCVDVNGVVVRDYPNSQLNDVAAADMSGGWPVIWYNPEWLSQRAPAVRRFFYFHECGHHALGHVARQVRESMLVEQQADCWAARELVNSGEFSRADLITVQHEMEQFPGSWSHVAGPQRALNLVALCLSSPNTAPAADPQPGGDTAIHIPSESCEDRCNRVWDASTCHDEACTDRRQRGNDRCLDRCATTTSLPSHFGGH